MILIINICKEPLHYFEFVKPIEEILKENSFDFKTISYKKINKKLLNKSSKAIICGTSLKDEDYLKNLSFFSWIKEFKKPLLGICAGHQIISRIFKASLKNKTEIGFYNESFKKDFLSLKDNQEVYHLHNKYTSLPKNFESFTESRIPQAIKHKKLPIYGVLFHPEVRNKKMILKFLKSKDL